MTAYLERCRRDDQRLSIGWSQILFVFDDGARLRTGLGALCITDGPRDSKLIQISSVVRSITIFIVYLSRTNFRLPLLMAKK